MKYSLRSLMIAVLVLPPMLALVVAGVAWAIAKPIQPSPNSSPIPSSTFPRAKPIPLHTLEWYPPAVD